MSKCCKCFDFPIEMCGWESGFSVIFVYIFGNYVYTMKMDEHRGIYLLNYSA